MKLKLQNIIYWRWGVGFTHLGERYVTVSFIDLYLVFPRNFRIVFLPHTNTVILLERYCGTITEPGLPLVSVASAVQASPNLPRPLLQWPPIYLFFCMYVNEPCWSPLKVRILLYCAHANEVRKASYHTYKWYITKPPLWKRSIRLLETKSSWATSH